MPTISNDMELRAALSQLSESQQRRVGSLFANSVIHLCGDERVKRALRTGCLPEASEPELQDAYKTAKGYAAKTYIACGKDTDWLAQADHFVASSLASALLGIDQLPGKASPAWKAAMQARMAKDCEMMEKEEGETETEAQRQYQIANELL